MCPLMRPQLLLLWRETAAWLPQAQLEGMKAERDALNASRRAEAAEARKALAEIDYLQVPELKLALR